MKRLCVIGDSHIGALRHAIINCNMSDRYQATFFTAHINVLSGLYLSNGRLEADSVELKTKLKSFSGGREHIDIHAYDEFIVIGLGFWFGAVASLYKLYLSDRMRGPLENKYLLSDASFVAVSQAAVLKSEALRLARLIRSLSDGPITVIPAPNPGIGLSEDEIVPWVPPCHAIVRNGDDQAVAALFREVCASVAKDENLTLIPPPAEAAANGVFNRFEYSALSEEQNARQPVDRMGAMLHGSKLYGSLLVGQIFGIAELS